MKIPLDKLKIKRRKPSDDEDVAAVASTPAAPAAPAGGIKRKLPFSVTFPRLAGASLRSRFATRQARFTLLIGDEGAILIYMKGKQVLSRQFVPDASKGNLDELRETLARDRQAPITMIIDSVDQSFVQQTLPPVSSLSVQKLIKRRLDRDFKPEDIKGALVLGKDKSGRRDWNFMMISVEKSPQLILWLDFIMGFENRFRGIVLLSVEAAIFLHELERVLGITASKQNPDSEWKILVSHNKVGGFRQIILRNNRLIFTRLALPVGEPTPAVIAGNIEQEMLSTIEYLKRFGFSTRTGLDVYIIASEEVCKMIEARRFDARHFHAFSPNQVATRLGIRGATQPTDQFGDVVLASAIGAIRKNALKLTTVESRLYDRFQMFKYVQRTCGTFIVLGLVIYAAVIGYNALIIRSELQDSEQKQQINENALRTIKQKISDTKIDLDQVGNQTELYKQIKSEARSPLPFLTQLSQSTPAPVSLKAVRWKFGDTFPNDKIVPGFLNFNLTPEALQAQTVTPPPPGRDLVTATVTLEFPMGLKSPALFKKFAEDALKEMQNVMPGYSMAYTTIPPEYLDTRSLQMNFDQKTPDSTLGQQPVQVEVTIRGLMPTAVFAPEMQP